MIRRSLRLRLALAGALAITVALAFSGAGLTLLFERHVYRTLSDDLDVDLRQIVGGLDIDPGGAIALVRPPPDPRFNEPLSGLYWQIDTPSGLLRSRSLWDFALAPPSDRLSEGQTHYHQIAGPGGKLLLVAERRVEFSARGRRQTARVFVASDLTRLRRARDAFLADLVPGLVLLALVLALATWLQLSLGLRPLIRLRREVADAISGGRQRLSLDAPDEVLPLVREVNALLDAQEKELERARGRAADLAHGLKTPLAALAGDARRLREGGDGEVAGSLEEIGESMRRHVERELARARVQGPATRRGLPATPLREIVEALIRTLSRTNRGEEISFENEIAGAAVAPIERMDLTELLGNLLDNAARHASTRVRVSCADDAGRPVIAIEDDGPGLDPDHEALVRQRGGRLDHGGGAGLGLALAQDILDAYGWNMAFSRSPLGGLRVSLRVVGSA
ncbi:HAMP domain-containing sensor histidine kinase [uncultured Rhodoblastus sp.]|uniref:ATP-binding protein n=1 Tax=uncultured Rhodoblastus sp. TaxID=543037 RepID=UPI0025F9EC59|nr:HAMP domain-containing sensor histidine kinase [uncultured Rhodoblastus sp.]